MLLRNCVIKVLLSVPSDCPFARTVVIMGKPIVIPPLCKLNPFYDNIIAWKMWAMEENYKLTH
jgi:hypothetical protein